MNIFRQVAQLLTCCLLLLAIAINKNQKILGTTLEPVSLKEEKESRNEWETTDGYKVISTESIAKDIWGYGGNIPLHIYLRNGTIAKIEILPNSESPEFLSSVIDKGLLSVWNGLSPEQAISKEVDAVTGATLSSTAIIASVQKAMQYVTDQTNKEKSFGFDWSDVRFWCIITIVLSGMLLPFFYKHKYFRITQLVMNVVVLGFWSGSFISLSLLVNYLSNGINLWSAFIPILLMIAAFIFPLFGKKSHYCMWICPMGSCQELIGKAIPYKLRISPTTIQRLTVFREILWIGIMVVMWFGVGFELLNYELFSAFLFRQASVPILVTALLFAALSGIVQRPYCRFVCPTGSVIKFVQQTK